MRLPNMSYCARATATAVTLSIAADLFRMRIALTVIAMRAAGLEP